MSILIDEKKMKQLFEKALVDVLENKRDYFYDVIMNVMEDIALARAIEEGKKSKTIDKKEIMKLLNIACK
jgi:hypothetical protein